MQIATVKEYAYIYFHQTFVKSAIVPPAIDPGGIDLTLEDLAGYWKVGSKLLKPGAIESDPLAQYLDFMRELKCPILFNPVSADNRCEYGRVASTPTTRQKLLQRSRSSRVGA